ncbi:MAG: ribosomal-processing cysteine protease Prp [Clostridiales bacterium]|nr:ribosomal-processing cysteine protease Prp [Clostridiales bacterium]
MTNVQILKQKHTILGFVVSGHSGYAEEGSDIVCSAISSLSQSAIVGLENVLNLKPMVKINEKKAYLSCYLPNNLTAKQMEHAQIVLKTFEQSVNLLLLGDKKLKKYITLEVKNEIY